MQRREFITLVGGAVVAWPLAALAQQPPMPVIGFLRSATLAGSTQIVATFRQGLKEAGFVEGQNVAIEYRFADDQAGRLPALAADLMRQKASVIVANSTAAFPVKAATTTIPIVFVTGSDPVKAGLVANLNRPGGNITGVVFFSDELGTKRLELLRQLVPKAAKIGLLVSSRNAGTREEQRNVQAAALAIGQQLIVLDVSNDQDIETALATLVERGASALFVGSGVYLYSKRERIVAMAARHSLPAMFAQRESVVAGGLMSYAASITDAYRQAGLYAGRILKGEKPADLPVMRSTKFEFVINLKTAKALGLDVPQNLLVAADEVIE
jgi:putative ABC transport system substrate-binding protein